MLFKINRASDRYSGTLSLSDDGAEKIQTNRIISNGEKIPEEIWVIEINTLEELIALVKRVHDKIIVGHYDFCSYENVGNNSLLIYDEYIE